MAWWSLAGAIFVAALATTFAGASAEAPIVGSATLDAFRVPDAATFLVIGVGLLSVARRRNRRF
jgi:hypothetical protein